MTRDRRIWVVSLLAALATAATWYGSSPHPKRSVQLEGDLLDAYWTDGHRLLGRISGEDLNLWDLDNGGVLLRSIEFKGRIAAFSADQSLMAMYFWNNASGRLEVWATRTGETQAILNPSDLGHDEFDSYSRFYFGIDNHICGVFPRFGCLCPVRDLVTREVIRLIDFTDADDLGSLISRANTVLIVFRRGLMQFIAVDTGDVVAQLELSSIPAGIDYYAYASFGVLAGSVRNEEIYAHDSQAWRRLLPKVKNDLLTFTEDGAFLKSPNEISEFEREVSHVLPLVPKYNHSVHSVTIYDSATEENLGTVPGQDVIVSADHRTLIVDNHGKIDIYDLPLRRRWWPAAVAGVIVLTLGFGWIARRNSMFVESHIVLK